MMQRFAQAVRTLLLFSFTIALSSCQISSRDNRQPPLCTSEILTSTWDREGATGFIYTWIEYTNITDSSCSLQTPPLLQLTDKNNTPLAMEYQMKRYEGEFDMPELVFETTPMGNEIILPASETAQIIVRWESVCPPSTPNGIVAHLALSSSTDVIKTVIVDYDQMCNEVGWTPQVTATGYIHASRR